jgi:hypothetical protein
MSYRYDAGGNRILKKVNNSETIYVRNASGNVMSTYTNDSAGLYQKEDISMAAVKRNVIKKMLI